MSFPIKSCIQAYCLCIFLLLTTFVVQGKEKIETPHKTSEGKNSIPALRVPWVYRNHPLLSKPALPLSLDPIRFTLHASKQTISAGEEVEITITAQLLDIPSSAFFIFEDQKSFSLKLLLPQGFTQTGGDYQEFIGGKLSTPNSIFTKRIRGAFASVPENPCFILLRGAYNANSSSIFEQKQTLCLDKKITPKATREADCVSPWIGVQNKTCGSSTYSLNVSVSQDALLTTNVGQVSGTAPNYTITNVPLTSELILTATNCDKQVSLIMPVAPCQNCNPPTIVVGAPNCGSTTYSFGVDMFDGVTLNSNYGTIVGTAPHFAINDISLGQTITLTATAANGCQSTIIVSGSSCSAGGGNNNGGSCTPPVLAPITPQTICYGGAFYTVNTSVTNGVETYYQWYNDNGVANNNTNPIEGENRANLRSFPTTPGEYKYKVVATSSANSACIASQSVTLTIQAPPTVTSTTGTNPSCVPSYGGAISVAGAGGTSFLYSKDNGGNWVDLTGANAQNEITRNAMLYAPQNDVARVKITLEEGFGLGPGGEYTGQILNQSSPPTFEGLAAGTYNIRVKDENGCISAPTAVTLTNPNAPAIFNVTGGGACLPYGAPINLSGSVVGVNYYLLRNGITVSGTVAGTGGALYFANHSTDGTYTVVASNASNGCSAQMNNSVVVSSGTPPAAPTNSEGDKIYCAGKPNLLGVSVGAGQTADWYSSATGGTPMSGGNGVLSFVPPTTGVYYVETRDITTQCKSTTRTPVTLHAAPTLSITGNTIIGCESPMTTLSAQTSISFPTNTSISYIWKNNTSNSVLATTPTLDVTEAATYTLTLSYNGCNLASSQAVNSVIEIKDQGKTVNVCAHENTVILTANAIGTGLTYQWYRDAFGESTPITGANNSTYVIPNITQADLSYTYHCLVTKPGCITQTSAIMALTGIINHPTNNVAYSPGSYTEFSISAIGEGITYQWQRNGVNIPGATSNIYGFNAQAIDQGAQYYCLVSSGNCTTTSDEAVLTLLSTATSCEGFKINAPVGYLGDDVSNPNNLKLTTSGCIGSGGTLTWKYTEDGIQKTSNDNSLVVSGRAYVFVAECAYANSICSATQSIFDLCFDYIRQYMSSSGYSSNPFTISEDGYTTLLKVWSGGCDRIEWSNGEIGNSIVVSLDNTATYLASCIKNGEKCGTVAIPVKKLDCNTFNISTGTPIINAHQRIRISSYSCTGKIIWKEGISELPDKGYDLYITPSQTTQYTATCIAGTTTCSKTLTITVAPNNCIDFSILASTTTINENENTILKATNCPGIVTWSNNLGTGNQVLVNPSTTTIYTANCQVGDQVCPPKTITITVRPTSAFKAWANQYEITERYEKAIIYTSGCGGATWGDGYYISTQIINEVGSSSNEGWITTSTPKNFRAEAGRYRLICHVSNCTNDCYIGQPQIIEIKRRPSCEEFNVSASKISILQGESCVLTAVGCNGRVQWNENVGIGQNKEVSPIATTTYTAICSSTNCQKSITVNIVSTACESFHVDIPQPNIPENPTESWTYPIVTGCQGTVNWKDSQNNAIDLTKYNIRNEINWSKTSKTYTVTCQTTGCQQSFTINSPISSSFSLIAVPEEISTGQSTTLTAMGCNGTVSWQAVPVGFLLNGRNVSPSQTTTYSATCVTEDNQTHTSFVTVVVRNTNCNLTINASPSTLNDAYYQETTLIASGCNGTITWNNSAGNGFKVVVSPAITTTYTATCTTATGSCNTSATVIVTPCTNFKTEITDNWQIRATGCLGKVIWENQGKEGTDFTPSNESTTYTAICTVSGCRSSIFYSKPIGYLYCQAFTAKANPSLVYYQTSTAVTFTATGCEAGIVKWSNGQTGTTITQYLSLTNNVTYTAECYINNQKVTSATTTIGIYRTSNGQPITSACKDFRINISPTSVAVAASYPPNTEFRVIASGCPGQVNWTTTEAAGGIITPSETKTYVATCLDNTGALCNSASATAFIEQDPCSIYGGYTEESMSRLDFLTNEIGINGETCPGKVIWYRSESRIESTIICTLSPGQPRYNLPTPQYETVRYFHDCFVSSSTICRGDVTFYINTKVQEARIAATGCLPQSLPASLLPFFQNLVCDSKSEWNRSDYLAAIQTAVTANPILSAYAPNFAVVNPSTFAATLQANDCQAAAQELIKAFTGPVSVDDFNDKIRPQYPVVLEKVLNTKTFYIMANGKAFELPQGAKPLFFQTNAYPNGVLQGFELANGKKYINKIYDSQTTESRFQQISGNQYLTDYIYPQTTQKGTAKAYFLIRYEANGVCGWRKYIGEYNFVAPNESGQNLIPSQNSPNNNILDEKPLDCGLNSYITQLQSWLQTKNMGKASVYVANCNSGNVTLVNATSQGEVANLTPNQAKTKVQNRDFTTDFAIYACKQADGTWDIAHKFKTGALAIPQGGNYTGTVAEVETQSNEAAQTVLQNNGVHGQSVDDELFYEELDIIKALVVVKDATLTLCNEAKVPEKFWDNNNADYPQAPFHGPTLSGVGDGAISELKDIPELVGFGLEIATEPEKAKATWNGIKSMPPAKVKKMLLGVAADKIAKYTGGGNTMKHEAGKDGVQMAMFVVGAVKSIGTNAAKIAELGGAADEMGKAADDVFTKATGKIDDAGSKTFTKGVKEGDLTAPDADELAEEVKDAVTPVDKSWMEIFIKGKQYEKRIDAKIDSKDAAYFDDAASKFGNITAVELKGLAEAKQLQINIGNGNFFVADNAFHRPITVNGKVQYEVWINETKLSIGTPPTPRQGEFLGELSKGITTFTVRSLDKSVPKDVTIIIKSVIKTGGNGTVSDTFSISKLF